VTEKVQQKNRGRKSAAKTSRQQIHDNITLQEENKRYGFHMCIVELMNLVEGLPRKSVGFPIGSLGLVVEWFWGRSIEIYC
jgi:hypothetical protein